MIIHSSLLKSISRNFRLTLYPRPFEQLVDLRRKTGAEIGVLKGEHALSMLKQGAAFLYLVDPYLPYVDFNEQEMDEAREAARKLLDGRPIAFYHSTSEKAASLLPDVDFAYIDGAHDYASVSNDIRLWWPKIKPGGVLGGHDFDNGTHASHDGVVKAVTEFAVANSLKLYTESPDWWIYKA